jgi:site-specific DNA recombinase
MNEVKSKCFVYLRRSQDRDDRQQQSIEKQDKRVREIVRENDLQAVFLPPEERSARKLGRPIFNEMLERIEKHEARYIAVWALSRLSRNPVDAGRVVHLLDEGHLLAIYTPTRTYRNTSDDKAFLAIELAFAKKTNDDLSNQVKEGFETKRSHGQYPGPAPIGYLNAIVGLGERNIVPDPEKAPKVVRLFEMATTGLYTLHDLWQEAKNIGLVSRMGKTLGKQTLAELLQRRAYTGVFKYGGEEWHQGSYEPLISVELFDQTQLAMGWVRGKRDRPATTSGRYYPYKGIIMCEYCLFNVTAYTKAKKLANGQFAEYIFYGCTKKNKKVDCKEHQVSAQHLEQEIKLRMQEYEISADDGLECHRWLDQHYDDYIKKRDQHRPIWLKQQREARKALDTLDEKLETGVITDERYKLRAQKHEDTLARTTGLLGASSTEAERWLELAKETFSGVVNLGGVFEIADDGERRRLMMLLGSNWYLGNKKVALTPRKPLNLLHNRASETFWRARPDSNRRSPP